MQSQLHLISILLFALPQFLLSDEVDELIKLQAGPVVVIHPAYSHPNLEGILYDGGPQFTLADLAKSHNCHHTKGRFSEADLIRTYPDKLFRQVDEGSMAMLKGLNWKEGLVAITLTNASYATVIQMFDGFTDDSIAVSPETVRRARGGSINLRADQPMTKDDILKLFIEICSIMGASTRMENGVLLIDVNRRLTCILRTTYLPKPKFFWMWSEHPRPRER